MEIELDPGGGADLRVYPLLRVVDSWGKTLRYDYYLEDPTSSPDIDTRRNVPVITSAGRDGIFDTIDDVSNIGGK